MTALSYQVVSFISRLFLDHSESEAGDPGGGGTSSSLESSPSNARKMLPGQKRRMMSSQTSLIEGSEERNKVAMKDKAKDK